MTCGALLSRPKLHGIDKQMLVCVCVCFNLILLFDSSEMEFKPMPSEMGSRSAILLPIHHITVASSYSRIDRFLINQHFLIISTMNHKRIILLLVE